MVRKRASGNFQWEYLVTVKARPMFCLPVSGLNPLRQIFADPTSGSQGRPRRTSSFYRDSVKRHMDFIIVVLAGPIIVVVVALLALIVFVDGGKPFYVQERVGLNGRVFRMWKLRTMEVDADQRLEGHLAADPAAKLEWSTTQKLENDPRITRFGGLLRKSSLDELPQFWNVLMGSMSLVGPRPMMPCQRTLYVGDAYYRLRPGITGPWQVSLRHHSSFADRALYDFKYEQILSLKTDLRILIKTVRVVCARTGC